MTDKFFLFSLSIFTSFNSMAGSAFTLCVCVCRGDCLMGTTTNAFWISADIFCQLNAVVRLQMCVFDFKIKVKSEDERDETLGYSYNNAVMTAECAQFRILTCQWVPQL